MSRYFLFILGLLLSIQSHAQQFQVESFKKVSGNASAVQEVMKDINDTQCALLRVKTTEANVKIAGNIIGDVMTNGTEYLVNVASGTKKITIVKKGFYPLTVVCSDYDFNSMISNGLYELKLKKIITSNEVSGEIGGHEYVDLGLSVKWATCNIGANKANETGDLFKYGETEPYDEEKEYTFMEDHWAAEWPKLQPINDVAHKKWGGRWRMPTKNEWYELERNCQMIWTTKNGLPGALFIAKNGNKLFLPSSTWDADDEQCIKYWTNEGGELDVKYSIIQVEGQGGMSAFAINPSMGLNVRAVSDLPKEPEVWQDEYSMKPDGYNNSHAYVDLGLSVKWATQDMEGYAERVNWQSNWRIPTKKEMEELLNKCTWTWTYDYRGKGVKGYIVTSKIPGYTDKTIFFPYNSEYNWNSNCWMSEEGVLCFNPYHYHWSTTMGANCISLIIRPVF